MIELKNVSKSFGKKYAVKNVNLKIESGDLLGLLGPNGAGKSTLISMLIGLITPSQGEILLKGQDIRYAISKKLGNFGVVFENPSFYEYLSGRENLVLFAKAKGCFNKDAIGQLLDMFSLSLVADSVVKKYSHGMKQRLAIANALIGDPEILIWDEPTNGLDPEGIYSTLAFLEKIRKSRNKTVIISSHQVHDVESICNKIAIIKEGTILCSGMIDTFLIEDAQSVIIKTDEPEECKKLIANKPWVKKIDIISNKKSLRDFYIEVTNRPSL